MECRLSSKAKNWAKNPTETVVDIDAARKNRERVAYDYEPKPIRQKGTAKFLRSKAWRKLRYAVLKKSRGCCHCCGAQARHGNSLHVDHIKPRALFPELALDLDNLQVLCEDCNLGKGHWDQTDWR